MFAHLIAAINKYNGLACLQLNHIALTYTLIS